MSRVSQVIYRRSGSRMLENMKGKRGLPVVEVEGKPFDMGEMSGRKCASRAKSYRASMAESIEYSTGVGWGKAVERAKAFLPYAEGFYPDFVEEIRGYASGAKMPFEDAFTMCCHELLSPLGFRGCTDMAFSGEATRDGNVLIGHNEDWSSDQLDTVVLLHAKPKGKPEFVTTAYAGLLPSSGMNSAGISLTGNALNPNDTRVGIPKVFPVRKALEARRIGEALVYAMPGDRASSYNNICSDGNGEIYSLEGSATDFGLIYAVDGHLVHTNHYTVEKMQRFEANPSVIACSIVRYSRASKLAEAMVGRATVETIAEAFRDHVNRPDSICRHVDPKLHRLDASETIFSVIFDLTNLEAHVLKGHPCEEGGYASFKFKG